MELKTLDDKDLCNITLAALSAFEKCLSPREHALKYAAQTVYKEIIQKSVHIDDKGVNELLG